MGVMWEALSKKVTSSDPMGVGLFFLWLGAMLVTTVITVTWVIMYYISHY